MKRDKKMGLNITQTMNSFNFENNHSLRNTAKDILSRQGASEKATEAILNNTIFASSNNTSNNYINPQLAILKASSQISLNNNLKETLKYLKTHAQKKNSNTRTFGELWNSFVDEKNEYSPELLNFEVDPSLKNIFAAA